MGLKGNIYKTNNLINGRIYIGQHSLSNINYLGSGIILKQAIKKYGRDSFEKEILVDGIRNKNLLNELEKHYIQLYASQIKGVGYNISKGGIGVMWGRSHTEEAKKKMSESTKGSKRSDKVKRQMSESRRGANNPMYGRNHTEEAKRKMGEANKGRTLSEENRRKLSEGCSRYHLLGIKVSQETKDRISKNNARYFLGRKLSDEHRKKIGKGNTGKQRILNCVYCNKSGGVSNMTRYHFENCKSKQL